MSTTLAPKILAVATIVSKIEGLGIHVIDASVNHIKDPNLGARIAVRGNGDDLLAIIDLLADSVVDPIRARGCIDRPTFVTNVVIDDMTIHLSGINV